MPSVSTRRGVRVALVVALTAACNKPHYNYEPRPPTPVAASDAERCVDAKRLSLATGSWFWNRTLGSATTVIPAPTGGFTIVYNPPQRQAFYDAGLIVYRGEERFSATEALAALGDTALTTAHADIIAANNNRYVLWRNSSLILTGVGSAGVLAGSAIVLSDPSSESNAGLYLMLGSVGVLALALIPSVLAYIQLPQAMTQERDRKLIVHPALARRVRVVARQSNDELARSCATRPGTLPMTDAAARLSGPE